MTSDKVFLGIGSSLGDRLGNLKYAMVRLLSLQPELVVTGCSSVYESPHMGVSEEDSLIYPAHLNAVVRVETDIRPEALLDELHSIENGAGRTRTEHWAPRTLDIDILAYGNRKISTDRLTIPHPGICARSFVIVPLEELGDLVPVTNLIGGCRDTVECHRIVRVVSANELYL